MLCTKCNGEGEHASSKNAENEANLQLLLDIRRWKFFSLTFWLELCPWTYWKLCPEPRLPLCVQATSLDLETSLTIIIYLFTMRKLKWRSKLDWTACFPFHSAEWLCAAFGAENQSSYLDTESTFLAERITLISQLHKIQNPHSTFDFCSRRILLVKFLERNTGNCQRQNCIWSCDVRSVMRSSCRSSILTYSTQPLKPT